MAVNISIPKLGMTMTSATIVEWKAAEGEWVEAHQIVMVIETEKVTYEVEAIASGYLHIMAEPGRELPVGEVAGFLADTEEELAGLRGGQAPTAGPPTEGEAAADQPVAAPQAPGERKRVKISPLARKMAEAAGIDIGLLKGSGPGGRIVKEDVERAIASSEAEAAVATQKSATAGEMELFEGRRVKVSIPLKGMRRAIARHMHQSLQVSAQLTTMAEIEMTEMIRLRDALVQREDRLGARISYTDLFVYLLAKALREVPIVNASLVDEEIKIWEDINIGVAVATQESEHLSGLIVPVIRNADQKSLVQISKENKALTEKARTGKLMPDDVSGGTFTLTNVGVFGVGLSFATPVINQPQSAILQTSAIEDRVVVRDGRMVIRPLMGASLTFDHRVIDGAPAAMFLLKVRELIEQPGLLIV